MRRLRPLSEAECYARCYGGWEPTVRVVRTARPEPPRPPPSSTARMSGEHLRRLFEERLDLREADSEAA